MIKKICLSAAIVCTALALWLYGSPLHVAHGQGEIEVKCGQILDLNFTDEAQDHIYLLPIEPRWSFKVEVKPFGEDLSTVIALYNPRDKLLDVTDGFKGSVYEYDVLESPTISSGVLSARGSYKIRVANTAIYRDSLSDDPSRFGGIGFYTLRIGCTTADGEKINPGDNPLPTPTPEPLPTATPRAALPENIPTFEGVGFPGLAPVDMSLIARVPLPLNAATYGVSPLDNQIYGFVIDAEAGDTLDLNYARSSGNMNLGLVLLSDSNEIFFQASLVASESLSTRLTLPEGGEYTIGIFRISLMEPEELEPTLFEISGALSSAE